MKTRFFAAVACAAGAVAFVAPAFAQTCNPPATSNGPDVVVGEIQGVANYTSANGVEAFSMGTYSCNIGNVWLNWFANTNQHPVIAQSLYKMKQFGTGANAHWQFEQIGQSWLKHGFFALSDNLCCNNCTATDGTHLGIHCSDPYTATRNGSQSGLGPKFQVNAATGAFPYPPANPAWSGSVARRLQAAVTDLEASSTTVRFFGATMYTVSDEPAFNRFNNQSYRAMNITGSGTAWNIAVAATTQRMQQGIRAWADNDTDVVERDIFVPNEGPSGQHGLFILAAKATDNGDGTWHYEYALQNYNSDRSGQAFHLPVPAGVALTNIGFHDVAYHSGDGQGNVNCDGTDWTSSRGSDGISWATQTFAENQNANALRWDTLYNFRYDASTAPDPEGTATITLFKPGTLTSVQATGIPVPSPGPGAPGDVDHDGDIDLDDLTLLLAGFGACQGDAAYNASSDFDGNGCIDLSDLSTLLANFGV